MSDSEASQLRLKASRLVAERQLREKTLLEHQRLLRGSLLERPKFCGKPVVNAPKASPILLVFVSAVWSTGPYARFSYEPPTMNASERKHQLTKNIARLCAAGGRLTKNSTIYGRTWRKPRRRLILLSKAITHR